MDTQKELAQCSECGSGVVCMLAWEDNEPILVLTCKCYGMRLGGEIEATPNRWK